MTGLNDNPYLRERDELLAHLVDDGTISAEVFCLHCGQAAVTYCYECGADLCEACAPDHFTADPGCSGYDDDDDDSERSGGDGEIR